MCLLRVSTSDDVAVPNKDLEISPKKSNSPRFDLEFIAKACGNFGFDLMWWCGTSSWICLIVSLTEVIHCILNALSASRI